MPFVEIGDVDGKTFDYVVVGGGTAGLILAARLSENASLSVLVLEAGDANLDDSLIMRPGQYGHTFGRPQYGWSFRTVPQKFVNGKECIWPRGKGLGGSSATNFAIWSKPPTEDINDWERLGNSGWNWETYEKYCDKAASYVPLKSSAPQVSKRDGNTMKTWRSPRGIGPLKIAHPQNVSDIELKLQEDRGEPSGTHIALNTVDPEKHTRTYSATAYLQPNLSRPNLLVLTKAYAHRLITKTEATLLTATGVEFSCREETALQFAHANKEVILCAGALKSPQILELSGIGRPEVLSNIGIPVKLPLHGVGENVQDHICAGMVSQLKDDVPDETFDLLRDPEQAKEHAELFTKAEGVSMMGIVNLTLASLHSFSPRAAELIDDEKHIIEENIKARNYHPGLVDQYRLMLERLDRKESGWEFLGMPVYMSFLRPPEPGKRYYSIVPISNYTFSRGTVHVKSDDPTVDPIFDPHYLEHDIDLQGLIDMVKYIRKICDTAPYKDVLAAEVVPGPEVQTDEEIIAWLKKALSTVFHVAGSLSMLPREKGGVVDSELKVYGTTNIRVADLSVVPLHFSAHPQATVYVIGELAADIILERLELR
ncbi:alcohol oxidase [Guyanagaster necrorhizus]|uniref:Alcohol oxidase n=1 Tax=Guyanagaster necrorhizus TaxID=856835 RepID=A0A9P8AUN7_9AGAR|nr:alcohol oxidase [Guyanagaster necrorhizus MCA 3950]KAG7448430.1 alcohol oxidase [Guyanagaster necrorhizus MCA 3950]